MSWTSVGEIASRLGCRPRDVSDLLYTRKINVADCPLVSGTRMIPERLVPQIRAALKEAGKLRDTEVVRA
jgi:hypothetical protein